MHSWFGFHMKYSSFDMCCMGYMGLRGEIRLWNQIDITKWDEMKCPSLVHFVLHSL